MNRLVPTLVAFAFLLSVNASAIARTPARVPSVIPYSLENSSETQGTPAATDDGQTAHKDSQNTPEKSKKVQAGALPPDSRLALIRYIDGELVRVTKSIPSGRKGFHLKAGEPIDERALRIAVASSGSAINPGDRAQITNLQFKDKEIIVDINGGGRGKTKLSDRVHLEVGGSIPTMTTSSADPVASPNPGATLYLDFDKPLPDMTPADLQKYLSVLIDFSKRHSASVQWVESLPPEIQKAIEEKQPVVGMDHEMVLAAMGRPDRKVREKNADGVEVEDWIYGTPPAKTVFVSFEGDKVTHVRQYPH